MDLRRDYIFYSGLNTKLPCLHEKDEDVAASGKNLPAHAGMIQCRRKLSGDYKWPPEKAKKQLSTPG